MAGAFHRKANLARGGTHGAATIAFGLASLFFLFEFVTRISPSLAAETMTSDLGTSRGGFGVVSSLFFWVYAPMQIAVGLLLDRLGARRLIVPAIGICALGCLGFAAAPGPVAAGAARMATGFGAAFAFVGALYVVNHWFAPARFALLSGIVNAVGMLGTAIGAVALSALIEADGWRMVLTWTGLAGLGLFVLALLLFRDAPAQQAAAPHPSPIDPLADALRSPQLWLIAATGALMYMPINVFGSLWGQSELTADHGLGAVAAETAVSLLFWGMAAGSIGAGLLSDRIGHRKWTLMAGILGSGLAWAAVIYGGSGSPGVLGALLFVAGLFGGAQMLVFAMAKSGHSAQSSGTVIAFVNMIGIGAALIFQPLVGWLVDAFGGSYAAAMTVIPAGLGLAALIVLLLREPPFHGPHRPE